MYRLGVFLLSVLCLTVLVQILAVVAWHDYRQNGDVSPVRALSNFIPGPFEVKDSDVEASGRPSIGPASLPEIRSELLYLINSERVLAQVPPLNLGYNASAQQHTESMKQYGYRSHWDVHGLTPQMRYTLAGGTNRVRQNIAGPIGIPASDDSGITAWRTVIREMHQGFMAGSAERANVLDPWHRNVSLGLSCNEAQCWVVQQFETDHLEFINLPTIYGTKLQMSGQFREGLELEALAVWFHPHSRRLSLGQLDATYRYGIGQKPATFVRPPASTEDYYAESLVSYEWGTGIDPYTLDAGLSRSSAPPLSVEVAHSAAVPWTTADRWSQDDSRFTVEADLSEIISFHGTGVYTVQIWGRIGADTVPLTNYSVFLP
ncbi:MAG: hypothetical protein OXR67_16610 [Chloroflexota bacterium]|nr:hypothetical protein [Chloroflexota bacterium]